MRSHILSIAIFVLIATAAAAGPAWGPPGWQNAPLDPSRGAPGLAHPTRFWMVGNWTGMGSQQGTGSSWSMSLTVTEQSAHSYIYKIDYPSLNCGGYWTFDKGDGSTGSFTEHIVYGRDKCVDLGTVTVGALAGSGGHIDQMAFHWTGTQPNGGQDNAGATLTRSQ